MSKSWENCLKSGLEKVKYFVESTQSIHRSGYINYGYFLERCFSRKLHAEKLLYQIIG